MELVKNPDETHERYEADASIDEDMRGYTVPVKLVG